MAFRIRQTVTKTETEVECDTSQEAADLLRAMRPTSDEHGLVELRAFAVNRMLPDRAIQKAQDDHDYKTYKEARGKLGYLGWSTHGKPLAPGLEVYDDFELAQK